jgi:MFS family permease
LVWGALSDKRGRKTLIVGGTFICAFGAGAISLIPDGAWLLRPIQVMSERVKPGSLAAGTTSGMRDSVASRVVFFGSLLRQ